MKVSPFLTKAEHFERLKIQQQHKMTTGTKIPVVPVKTPSNLKTKYKKSLVSFFKFKFNKRNNNLIYHHTGSFQEAIGPVLLMAQIFSLMPVRGILDKDAHALKFSWKNARTLYSLLIISSFGICSGLIIAYTLKKKLDFDAVDVLIFYTSIFLIALQFLNLARKWPNLCVEWQNVESRLPVIPTDREKSALSTEIKSVAAIITLCSLVEHILSMLSMIYFVNACPPIPDHPIQSFFYINLNFLFHFVAYNDFLGILGKILNLMSTFAWNFNDIFVMVISLSLARRFNQVNQHMRRAAKHSAKAEYWDASRINYRNLCKLCEKVDDAISSITLLCFANNLFFICGKIMKSLQKKPSLTHTVYFWFSLIYLLGRTLTLSLYISSIYDVSKEPLVIFRAIPREHWCPELQRFSEEVAFDTVALSGMKFFQLTRGVVLSVAGTIVTYELVLLQFSKEDKVNDCFESAVSNNSIHPI